MKSEARIKVCYTEKDLDARVYHLSVEISNYPFHSFQRPLREGSLKDDVNFAEIGEIGSSVIREIFAIPGVHEVFIKPYELSVKKGTAFEWQEIELDLIETLKKKFEGKEVRVIYSKVVGSDFDTIEDIVKDDVA